MPDRDQEGRAALASVATAWNSAARRWNPSALSAIYTDDALLFGGRPDHSIGARAIRDYFESYDGIIASASLELVDQHLIELSPHCFVAQGYGHFSFVLADQQKTRSYLRTTLIIVQQDRWKIRQHHFSPPPTAPPIGAS